jgi:hypothetical protein
MGATTKSKVAKPQSRRRKMINRVTPVIGALIVFGTFVVNDLLREKTKGISDAITQAQRDYTAWRNHNEDEHNCFKIQDRLVALKYQVSKLGDPDDLTGLN